MSRNENLKVAKKVKNDEFYTLFEDIEKECQHYKKHFEGKTIYCNTDNALHSNFFLYFANNFNILRLKKLVCTCYDKDASLLTPTENFIKMSKDKAPTKAYKITLKGIIDVNEDGFIDGEDIRTLIRSAIEKMGNSTSFSDDYVEVEYLNVEFLNSDSKYKAGDFRSEECIDILKECDIVVTNPPFSLFREFITTILKYHKDFLVIGNMNAITYKDVFPLIKENKMWLGYNPVRNFLRPDGVIQTFGNIGWFTNLDVQKRHTQLPLNVFNEYTPEKYPTYYNYDAICVNKINEIPCDYFKEIGVPISFLEKHNPEQFDLIGCSNDLARPFRNQDGKKCSGRFYIKSEDGTLNRLYDRVVIKRKV